MGAGCAGDGQLGQRPVRGGEGANRASGEGNAVGTAVRVRRRGIPACGRRDLWVGDLPDW